MGIAIVLALMSVAVLAAAIANRVGRKGAAVVARRGGERLSQAPRQVQRRAELDSKLAAYGFTEFADDYSLSAKLVLLESLERADRDAARKAARAAAQVAAPSRRRPTFDLSRQQGYWYVPPVPLATDVDVDAAMAAAPGAPQICFTGWSEQELEFLRELAEAHGFRVMTGIAKRLTLLCVGETPGPVKIATARSAGVPVVSASQLEMLIKRRAAQSTPSV